MTDLFKSNASLSSSHLGNLRLAKLWLARCWVNHPQCLQPRVPLMPKRLVDVGPQDGSRDPVLVVPHALSRYLALSHCWGNDTVPKTTTENLSERQIGIPFSSLSKTFQEAIQITRAFGIRYIWIDSLCILQDSIADWEYGNETLFSFKKVLSLTQNRGRWDVSHLQQCAVYNHRWGSLFRERRDIPHHSPSTPHTMLVALYGQSSQHRLSSI